MIILKPKQVVEPSVDARASAKQFFDSKHGQEFLEVLAYLSPDPILGNGDLTARLSSYDKRAGYEQCLTTALELITPKNDADVIASALPPVTQYPDIDDDKVWEQKTPEENKS